MFGNNGRPSYADLAKKTLETHIEAESDKIYTKQKVYIKNESEVKNSKFYGCRVVIESTATVKGCTFKNCILKKGHYPAVSNNRYKNNKWFKNISIDQMPIKGGVQIDKLWRSLPEKEGDDLCDAVYSNDFNRVIQLCESLIS